MNYSAEFGSLHQEENAASTYSLSTSFITWTSMNESDSSSGITADIVTHDITVSPAGVYNVFFHASFEGSSGKIAVHAPYAAGIVRLHITRHDKQGLPHKSLILRTQALGIVILVYINNLLFIALYR